MVAGVGSSYPVTTPGAQRVKSQNVQPRNFHAEINPQGSPGPPILPGVPGMKETFEDLGLILVRNPFAEISHRNMHFFPDGFGGN
jgi:hypothetical protein